MRLACWFAAGLLVANVAVFQLSRVAPGLAAAENGVMEITQVCLLVATLSFYLVAISVQAGVERVAAIALALLTAGIILRELDFRFFDAGNFLTLITGRWRDMVFLSIVVLIASHVFWYRRMIPSWVRLALLRPGGWYFIAAWVLLAAGYMIDRLVTYSQSAQFYEELFELNAYMFYLSAAWHLLKQPELRR